MMLSVPEITTSSPESSWPKNSRRASFSSVQWNPPSGVRFATIQVPSLPIVTVRRSSVSRTQIQAPLLKQARSDTILEREQQRSFTLLRTGSITTRARSNSVYARGLGLPAFGLCRGRRRSRVLSARAIKIFQVRGRLFEIPAHASLSPPSRGTCNRNPSDGSTSATQAHSGQVTWIFQVVSFAKISTGRSLSKPVRLERLTGFLNVNRSKILAGNGIHMFR